MAIEPPVPQAWWVAHGGFGLLAAQHGEVELDLHRRDPNAHIFSGARGDRARRAVFGDPPRGRSIAEGSCFDRSLRAAELFEESRAATLRSLTVEETLRALERREVRMAKAAFVRCMHDAGYQGQLASDPKEALRRRFLEEGLIRVDGQVRTHASAVARAKAKDLERDLAETDLRCRSRSRFDEALDRSIRLLLGESP